ncbi:MAG: hypothetical protein HRU25_13390 [Psychrobium sp.]|nr:hypothetical protein [Psychrobium sp.]
MKNSIVLKLIVIISILITTVWIFWPVTAMVEQEHSIQEDSKVATAQPQRVIEPTVMPLIKAVIKLEKITSNDSASLIAKAYGAELTFPAYSQPLSSNDFDRLNQNHFNPQSIPVDDNGTTISASLSKYRYTFPEIVLATLTGDNIDYAQAEIVDVTSGDVLLTSAFEYDGSHWSAQFVGQQDFPDQLQVNVRARVSGKNITMALALKYIDSVATLEGFEPAFHQDADMVIRAKLTTKASGLYRLRANLFDANQQPIAHLVGKEKLDKGSNTIDLKAHQSVLQGHKGSLYLSSFTIELMSPAPGKPTRYGDSAISQFEIKNFAITHLNDTPYQPSKQEQQRLLLLQKMANGQ